MPTTTVEQFLKALAVVESSDDPEAWGDGGRAMGRWQVHPDALWDWCKFLALTPKLGETWDQLVGRVLRAAYDDWAGPKATPVEIAMRWHGHWCKPGDSTWDAKYAARFEAALLNTQEEMP